MNLIEALKSGKPFRLGMTTVWLSRVENLDYELCLIGEDVKNGNELILRMSYMGAQEFLSDDWEVKDD